MKRLLLVFICLLLLPVNSLLAGSGKIYHITLNDQIINPVSAEYILHSIEKAQADQASLLIIELDTPGGLLTSTRNIVKAIMNANVPIAVYVSPAGARAGSAGVFITLASHIAAMAPSTNIGAAHPVNLGGDKKDKSEGFKELLREYLREKSTKKTNKEQVEHSQNSPMEDKVLNDTTAWVRTIAKNRNRNVDWAIKSVTKSASITEEEAVKQRVVDLVAKNITDLIAQVDGREIELPSGRIKLSTQGLQVVSLPMSTRLNIMSILAHPNIAYILMMLGFYGLLFEFTHPGIGFPGVAGTICIILAFFGLQVLPTNYAGVALIVLGIILFAAEVKIVSYGLLSLGAITSLFFGSLFLFDSPHEFMQVSLPLIFAFTASTFGIFLLLFFVVLRSRRVKSVSGAQGMIGEIGEVRSWDGFAGKVFVHGELWNAGAGEEVKIGEKVKVEKIDGLTLFVTRKTN